MKIDKHFCYCSFLCEHHCPEQRTDGRMGRELGLTISTRWWSSAHVGSLIQIQFVYGIVGGGGGRFEWQQQIYEALFVSLSKGKWHLYSSVRKTYPDPSIWARKFKAFYCGGLWNRVNSGRNVFACLHVEMLHWYRMFLGILIIIVSRQPKVNFLHSWTVVSPKFPVRSSTCIVKAY